MNTQDWMFRIFLKLFVWYVKIGDYFEVGWWND